MDVRALHHVALAVENLDDAIELYARLFGAEVEERGRIEEQGVEAAYLRCGNDRLELVSPLGPETPVGRFLERRGPGMHHIAFEVSDIEEAIAALGRTGANVIEPAPRTGFGGHRVAFVHPESLHGVLAEVVGG